MRAGDVLRFAGRPVAYHAGIAQRLGSITGALMLGQLLYWTDKSDDGWVWKVEADWFDELALTAEQLKGARSLLLRLNLIEHKRAGLPAKPYYRVNFEGLDYWWRSQFSPDKFGENPPTGPGEMPEQDRAKGPDIPLLSIDDTRDHSQRTRDFDAFWSVYPRKEAKKAAREAFTAACKRERPEVILAGAERYRDDPNRDPSFTKHATTWLRADCWADDPLPPRSKPIPRGPHRPTAIDTDRTAPSGVIRSEDL